MSGWIALPIVLTFIILVIYISEKLNDRKRKLDALPENVEFNRKHFIQQYDEDDQWGRDL